jgi:hypothetical protein
MSFCRAKSYALVDLAALGPFGNVHLFRELMAGAKSQPPITGPNEHYGKTVSVKSFPSPPA